MYAIIEDSGQQFRVSEGDVVDVDLRDLPDEATEVEFLPVDPAAIARYVRTGEPMDKAGAYGIQGYGALMVRGVSGCYFNVMGLPLAQLGALLRRVLSPAA